MLASEVHSGFVVARRSAVDVVAHMVAKLAAFNGDSFPCDEHARLCALHLRLVDNLDERVRRRRSERRAEARAH